MAEILTVVEALGGGLSAFIIAALGWFAWRLFSRVSDLQDARLADALAAAGASAIRDQEHRDIMRGMEEAVRANTEQMRELRHNLDRAGTRRDV